MDNIIITFDTTQHAIKAENFFINNNVNGRIIPLPSKIDAGCGMCYKMTVKEYEKSKELINMINYNKIYYV